MRRLLVLVCTLGCSDGSNLKTRSGIVVDAGATVPFDLATAVSAPDLGPPPPPPPPPDLGNPAGPWPIADLTLYGAAQGLGGGLVDATADDGEDIWAASTDTLYLLRPGSASFVAFTAADGLRIQPFIDPYGNANQTSITALAGGRNHEIFVGYYGYETTGNPYLDTEAQKELGNADRIVVSDDNKLHPVRYFFRCDYEGANGCWENRSPRRMLYAHDGVAAGHLFIGFNHGVSHVFNDTFGDHVHPEVWYQPGNTEKIGEFYGLAVLPTGDLWMAGRYGVGLQPWNPQPHFAWVDGRFIYAFTTNTANHDLNVPSGYREDNRGAAVTPDGTVWLARLGGGLASWNPAGGHASYQTIRTWPQVPSQLLDVQADPDGTLWLVDGGNSLLRFDPAQGTVSYWPGVSGVTRIYVDTRVIPRALYVSMTSGLAVIRAK